MIPWGGRCPAIPGFRPVPSFHVQFTKALLLVSPPAVDLVFFVMLYGDQNGTGFVWSIVLSFLIAVVGVPLDDLLKIVACERSKPTVGAELWGGRAFARGETKPETGWCFYFFWFCMSYEGTCCCTRDECKREEREERSAFEEDDSPEIDQDWPDGDRSQ